jgi:hypothetical protein
MRKPTTLLLFAALASQLGNTDCGQALRDPGYDLWCDGELCAWKVERGEIKRVATWHEGDSGVELVGPDTAISQLSPLDSADGHCRDVDGTRKCTSPDNVCLEFTLLANIDGNAAVDLNLDIFNDGTIEHTEHLPISKWQSLSYKIVIGQPFAGVRFQLAKSGSGVAQLANIGAKLADNCDGLPVIEPGPAPLGAPCQDASDCTSGICAQGESPVPFPGVSGFLGPNLVCVGCDVDHNCTPGVTVCGVGGAMSPVRAQETVCVPLASKQLGESCFWSNECASNYCRGGVCSTCTDNTHCAGGETCGEGWDTIFTPWVCNPGGRARQTGEPCVDHADCASDVCVGTERKQCDDGRECVTAAQCPFRSGLESGPCTTVGIQGGSCQ